MGSGPALLVRPGRFLIASLLMTVGCSQDADSGTAVSATETQTLNEAAAALDANAAASASDEPQEDRP